MDTAGCILKVSDSRVVYMYECIQGERLDKPLVQGWWMAMPIYCSLLYSALGAAAVELVTSEQNRASRNAGEGGYDLKWSPQIRLVFRCEGEPS